MFLNKLTGTQIGLTAWDMFVINKPAILTVSMTAPDVKFKNHSGKVYEMFLYGYIFLKGHLVYKLSVTTQCTPYDEVPMSI